MLFGKTLGITPLTGGCDVDLFYYDQAFGPEYVVGGQFINGYNSVTWIERYRDPGEFTIVADLVSGLQDKILRGSFISHINSRELMIVENIEINGDKDGDQTVTFTGRSYETHLENRLVGSNLTYPIETGPTQYTVFAGYVWQQATDLIRAHIDQSLQIDPNDGIPNVEVGYSLDGLTVLPSDINEARGLKLGSSLYKEVISILGVSDVGIRSYRPGPWGPATNQRNIGIEVHRGQDKSAAVRFSYQGEELITADLLWSIKPLKNCAIIASKWFTTRVMGPETGYNRRMISVDATDLDEEFETAPTGSIKDAIIVKMEAKGRQKLAQQNELELSNIEVNPELVTYTYRSSYEVGDIITVFDERGSSDKKMRVTEYVEIEDENGEKGYPTLSAITEEQS
jgi:hypothetical protein